jgi:hypothetical protein
MMIHKNTCLIGNGDIGMKKAKVDNEYQPNANIDKMISTVINPDEGYRD